MVGILIVAHGAFGEALIHCASHVLGKRPLRVQQVGVTVHDDPDAILLRVRDLVQQLDEGDGVLVLTDIVGATPSNIAVRLATLSRVEIVGGVNLPMLKDGVLVLTDIVGATPSNIAVRLAALGRVEIVGGVNLPMLIRALTYRDRPLAQVVAKAVSGGREGVVALGEADFRGAG